MNFKDWLIEDAATEAEAQADASDATESSESTPLGNKEEKQVERKSGCGSCSYFPFCVKKKKKRKHR